MGLSKCEMGGLGAEEEGRYEWQMLVRGIGEEGQKKLKGSSVLVSRVGGIGGTVAYLLAAAGVGRLVLAHGGILKPSDLNRQLLMTTDWVGKPRIESAVRRLRELNPNVEIHGEGSNINEENVGRLVGMADIVVDAAPLFEERFLMNREACGRVSRWLKVPCMRWMRRSRRSFQGKRRVCNVWFRRSPSGGRGSFRFWGRFLAWRRL